MFGKIVQDVFSGFKKFMTVERLVVLILFIVLMWGLVLYTNDKTMVIDKMEDGTVHEEQPVETSEVKPATQLATPGYSTKEVANPKDLLPSDANSQWAALNPNTMQDNLSADLLKAGQHIGIDSVGQSLRNANLQLRADPLIPKVDVGPWNQTTIEPDTSRAPLDLGIN